MKDKNTNYISSPPKAQWIKMVFGWSDVPMRILERVQAFLLLLIIEILLFFLFSKFKWGKNDCTNSRVRIVIYYYSHIQVLHSIGLFRYQGPQEKLKKANKNSNAISRFILQKFYNFFVLCEPFWHKNSGNQSS